MKNGSGHFSKFLLFLTLLLIIVGSFVIFVSNEVSNIPTGAVTYTTQIIPPTTQQIKKAEPILGQGIVITGRAITDITGRTTHDVGLPGVSTWMYQIQRLDWSGEIEALEATNYEMLVLEPTYTDPGTGWTMENAKNMINKLRIAPNGKKRIILAYIDIGEAEEWRYYWTWSKGWNCQGNLPADWPDYIVACDPDGWSGNYPVAYWSQGWKDIWLGSNGQIQELAQIGFDGVYLDWVEAYDDTNVIQRAQQDGVHAANEMVKFIQEIRDNGKAVNSSFLVVQQNAPFLLDDEDSTDQWNYLSTIDGIAQEGIWFQGDASDNWNDPKGGDIPNSWTPPWDTNSLIVQYNKYENLGKPVFTVDYALKQQNADFVYQTSKGESFTPLVTRVCLCKLTETPPPPCPAPECGDGIDNSDLDGLIDMNDPGCSSASDTSEISQCEDSLDNDADGKTDYGTGSANDKSCANNGDNDETVPQQCSDTFDNDGDGLIDMNDPGCSSSSDNDETNTPSSPPGDVTNTYTLNPTDDSFVAQKQPTRNYGNAGNLKIDGSPIQIVYMKYDLRPYAGKQITKAKLRMYAADSSNSMQNVKTSVDNSWTEGSVNYNNRPQLDAIIAQINNAKSGNWIELDITNYIPSKAGQLVTLGIDSSGRDGLNVYSSESSVGKPELVIDVLEQGTAPPGSGQF